MSKKMFLVSLLFLFVVGCSSSGDSEEVAQGPLPQVFVFPGPQEERLISQEIIDLPNCTGNAESSQEVTRAHTVLYTLELGREITVSADGRAGVPGIGEVGVGVAVATEYRVGYGRSETVSRAQTVRAAPESHMQHTIQQFEVWETGEVLIVAGEINQRLPYSFRRDFSIKAVAPANLGCFPDGIATPESPPDERGNELDTLFGAGNWFCFPDRTNGIGVQLLPENLTVQEPLRLIETYRGPFHQGDVALGGNGATAWLTLSLSPSNCPALQQAALTAWETARTTGQIISSSSQIDELLGTGNWECLSDYTFGVRVFYVQQEIGITYPITTADISNGKKLGVGDTIPSGGEATIWFIGNVPENQCP
jgi:hypothetical protein